MKKATVIFGYSGSGKTNLINKIIRENRENKFHVYVEELKDLLIDSFMIEGGTFVIPFTIEKDQHTHHEDYLVNLFNDVNEVLGVGRMLIEVRTLSSIKSVMEALSKAGIKSMELITVINGKNFNSEIETSEWFIDISQASDFIYVFNDSEKSVENIVSHKKCVKDSDNFDWFGERTWSEPKKLISFLQGKSQYHPPERVICSILGTLDFEKFKHIIDSFKSEIHSVKGVLQDEWDKTDHFNLINFNFYEPIQTRIAGESQFNQILTEKRIVSRLLSMGDVEYSGFDEPDYDLGIAIELNDPSSFDTEIKLSKEIQPIIRIPLISDEYSINSFDELKENIEKKIKNEEFDTALDISFSCLQKEFSLIEKSYIYKKISEIYREFGLLYKALTAARFAVSLHETAENLEEMARVYNNLDNYNLAVKLLLRGLNLEGDHKSSLLNLMRLHLVYDNASKALDYLDRAFILDPDEWETVILASHIYLETGEYEKMLSLYSKFKPRCDCSEDFLLNLSSAHLEHKHPESAIVVLDELFKMDPENDGVLYLLGYAYLTSGNMEKALEILNQCLEMGNDISFVFLALGLANEYLGKKKDAHELFNRSEEQAINDYDSDPSYPVFIEGLILSYIAVGKSKEAGKLINKVDFKFSHEFHSYVKLLSCFKLPDELKIQH